MKGAAYVSGWLIAAILVILACFSTPAAAHSAHRHAPAATTMQVDVEARGVASAHVAQAAAVQVAPAQAPDTAPCEAPCCTGHGCGCSCAVVTWVDRTPVLSPIAAREPRPGHDRSRPSRAAEAPSEPPRSFQ